MPRTSSVFRAAAAAANAPLHSPMPPGCDTWVLGPFSPEEYAHMEMMNRIFNAIADVFEAAERSAKP